MVTLQEVEERETQLKEAEEEAQKYVNEPIPQRRFGVGVTKEQQQAVILRRQQAKINLQQVAEQRESLKQTRKDIQTYEQQQAQLSELKRQEEQYQYGYKLGLKGVVDPSFSKIAKQGFKDARNQLQASNQRVQRIEQIRKLEAEGIKPILDNKGVIVGIEDKITGMSMAVTDKTLQGLSKPQIERYQRAGLIKITPQTTGQPQLTPQEKLNLLVVSKVAEKRLSVAPKQPFFGKVEGVIQYPFKKVAYYERKYQEKILPGYNVGYGKITKAEPGQEPYSFGEKGSKFIGEIVSFPVYGAKQIELYATNKKFREEYQRETNLKKSLEYGAVALSLVSLGSIGRSAYRYAKKPIKVYEQPKLPSKFYSETRIKTIRMNEKAVNIGAFEVTAVTLPRKALYIPRYSKILSGIKKSDVRLLQYSPEQLSLMFPRGQIVEIQPLRITKSTTEPFIVSKGRIQNALGRQGPPAVFTGRASFYEATGRVRFTSRKISSLYGETYGSKSLKTLSKSREELSEIQRLALQRLEETQVKGIKALPKELDLQASAIETKDLLKIQSKGVKPFAPGKTIARGDILSVQKELLTIDIPKQYGLKEVEVLGERLAVVDVTKPRFRPPKKITKIEGRTIRKEYELPDLTPSDIKVQAPGSTKTQLKFDNKLNQEAIQKAVGSVALSQPKAPTSKLKSTIPEVKSAQVEVSPFAGTGLYERTSLEAQRLPGIQKFVQAPGLTPAFKSEISLKAVQIPKAVTLPRALPKEITKELPKEVSLSLPKSITRLTPKTITKQTPKQVPKQIVKQVPKTIPSFAPPVVPIQSVPIAKTPPPIILPKLPGGKISQPKGVPGYKPYVVRGGEKIYLGGALPKGTALRKAEAQAIKGLGATFGVEPAQTLVLGPETSYTPQKDLFRAYRIKQGKKIPLQDTFIQKRGKRLVSPGEIKEIQIARAIRI